MPAGVPMAAPSTRFARSLARSACSRAFMAPRSLHEARRRRSPRSRWAPRRTCSASTCSSRKTSSNALCCTTTSRHSAWARSSSCAVPVAAKSATALQMDIKVLGISINMMREALAQAKKARLQILDTMEQTLNTARTQISAYAPRLYKLSIPTDKIRDLIGPGGKKIKSITEQTGVKIDVLEDGTVHIFSTSGASGDAALAMVREVTASAEVAKTYLGKVVRLAEFGAFVELFPGTDGLLHISEISEHRIRDVRDELKLGDQVLVKVLSIEGNKIRLSRKALLKEAREKQQKAAAGGGGHNPGSSEGGAGNAGGHE